MTTTRNGQSATTTYQYDGLGRRIRKETAGVVREYVYSGDHLILEVDGQGRDLAEYVYYPGVDAPHSMRRRDAAGTWRTYYYLTEAPGHVVGLIDETGLVVKEYAYTPFGEITETTPAGVAAVENPLTYTAREWDAEVGLYFYRARYYDPLLQRFISEDPIGLAGGSNPYAYVGNDPINSRDPSGLCTVIWWGQVLEGVSDHGLYVIGWGGCGSESRGGSGQSWRSDRGAAIMTFARSFSYVDPYGLGPEKCPPNCDNPSVLGAYGHYIRGSGKDLTMNFAKVNLSNLDVTDIPEVAAAIKHGARGPVEGTISYKVPGWQNNLLGNITVKVSGTVQTSCDELRCGRSFQGVATALPDTYDFNKAFHRGRLAEGLTTVGRNTPGVPYKIIFGGSQKVKTQGVY